MAGRPQTLTKGQEEVVVSILRKTLLKYCLIGFALLAGLTGMSLWGIMVKTERNMSAMVAQQFEEPRIQEVTKEAARERASLLMKDQIQPEVAKFKSDVAKQNEEIKALVEKESATIKSVAKSLVASIAWRRISNEQYTVIVDALKGKVKGDVWVEFVKSDPETTVFRGDIWKTLTDAGLKLKYFSGWDRAIGLQITNTDTAEGKIIAAAFDSAGIPFRKKGEYGLKQAAENVEIIIGTKSPEFFAPPTKP